MTITLLLETNPLAFTIVCLMLGLLVGSFLNVVIHRLPIMLEREWQAEYVRLGGEPPPTEKYNLVVPRSRCPHCGHPITALENIPLLSYAMLRGRCSACHAPISPRYVLVEAVSGLISAGAAWHFGFAWAALGALVLGWGLLAMSVIDLEKQLLPDKLTLPLLWLGLLFNLGHVFTDINSAVIGAAAGYLVLWGVYHLFRLATGKEGMGYGDFKLLALLGAWLGWQRLPVVIILSAGVGAVVGLALLVSKRMQQGTPMPFGPFLAAAGWIALIWGAPLTDAYLSFTGVH
ncbi:MAG TPA: prepilin peptidase [Gammaproteobacteria bacterium]|nr:prepilin peptidase [Gammaproteobacteria bacterium]